MLTRKVVSFLVCLGFFFCALKTLGSTSGLHSFSLKSNTNIYQITAERPHDHQIEESSEWDEISDGLVARKFTRPVDLVVRPKTILDFSYVLPCPSREVYYLRGPPNQSLI